MPPVLLRPAKLRRGLKWQSVYKVGAIVFRRESAVVGRQAKTIAGRTVRTWVIQTKETVTGALHGDESRKEWWSPTLGVDVRVEWHRNLDGTIVNIMSAHAGVDEGRSRCVEIAFRGYLGNMADNVATQLVELCAERRAARRRAIAYAVAIGPVMVANVLGLLSLRAGLVADAAAVAAALWWLGDRAPRGHPAT